MVPEPDNERVRAAAGDPARSQNGYLANREDLTRVYEIPGCDRHVRLRQGPPGLLLVHFAAWFDARVEPLDRGQWDEWGYAERPIRGSDAISNHASGTAIDLNATRHPLGTAAADTFTRDQLAAIRRRLRLYGGCLRWGGDYRGRPDPMHFEIDARLAVVRERWRRLRRTPIGRRVLLANNG